MTRPQVKADLKSLKKAFRAMERAGGNPKKVWRSLRTPLRKDQKDHMRSGEDSDRAKWKPLAASTIAKRLTETGRANKFTKKGKKKKARTARSAKRGLGKLLSTRLVSGARVKVTRSAISITSKVPWAGVHQKGGRVGRGSKIPAREFFYIGDPLLKMANKAFALHIAKAFNKGG